MSLTETTSLFLNAFESAFLPDGPEGPVDLTLPDGPDGRLGHLAEVFTLSTFEQGVLALALACELFPVRFRRVAALHLGFDGDLARGSLTPHLALDWLTGGDPSAFLDGAPLLRWGLLLATPGVTPDHSMRTLRVAPGVLAYAHGADGFDPALSVVAQVITPTTALSESQEALLAQGQKHFSKRADDRAVMLYGSDPQALRDLAAHLMGDRGEVLLVDLAALATRPDDLAGLTRTLGRDTRLKPLGVVLDAGGDLPEGVTLDGTLHSALAAIHGPFVLLSDAPLPLHTERAVLPLEVHKPSAVEQRAHWAAALHISDPDHPGVRQLADQFRMSLDRIDALALEVRASMPGNATYATRTERAWQAARVAGRRRLGSLAQRVTGTSGWDDLVLPAPDLGVLKQIVAHVRHRADVYEVLGARATGRGRALTALFSGPSGTGKTLSAEVLANELKLDLYRIDLSSTVSKYIGETEKNLKRIFDAADDGGCILLFDEADAVFGKRSEVKDAHDRYANVQVNYLLQRLEAFNGLTILTTNLESSMDSAFMRRIQFVLNFRAPGPQERERLWRTAFPDTLDTSGVNFAQLARADIAGGNIRSVAMNAVFMAVSRGEALSDGIVHEALLLEYRKLGRLVLDDGHLWER
ncbi:ATP-binding protein [Deinococcus maricopensis]|uniref:AAA ATPase central domain protein n=1 Tax=Deinococcus maricopensis (strain DSM 21211 / LMG 22137 / NRRL B-23946 / LB-34) TaxID=709986 RepID=E8U3N0_DEIML|nr:ATP-binding protein [Deinococcus maricopensis]ADV68654.1 AAA ATPase central domain protein [Deinococcus maricopensis DSM 21211]